MGDEETLKERQPTAEETAKTVAETAKVAAGTRVAEATVRKLEAEAVQSAAERTRLFAEARRTSAEADIQEATATAAQIGLKREQEKFERDRLYDDWDYHRYHFSEAVGPGSVRKCIDRLTAWHRHDPKCKLEIAFSSPGGSVIDGMELFDFISSLRATHKVTTSAFGYAASMAGILLQAGDRRVIGKQAYILIHEVSFGTQGSFGEVEDEVAFVKKIQGRVLDIFADRCAGAAKGTATKRLTRRTLAKRWSRTDWWLDADEALAYGLVDEIVGLAPTP
jgi:ATP-dependent protease ClpP protease subunit